MIVIAPDPGARPCLPAMSPPADPTRYRLTTAELVDRLPDRRLPDRPDLLQTFIWQKFDLAPDFPELSKFLDFWAAISTASCTR